MILLTLLGKQHHCNVRSSSCTVKVYRHFIWRGTVHQWFTWGCDCTRMHYWKKMSWWRQCDALVNFMLGNLRTSHVDFTDTYHLHTYHLVTKYDPSQGWYCLMAVVSQHNHAPCYTAKMVHKWLKTAFVNLWNLRAHIPSRSFSCYPNCTILYC